MRCRTLLFVVAVALASCGGAEGPPVTAPRRPVASAEKVPDPPETRQDGRLPSTAHPTHYELSLDVDPRAARFRGTATISVAVDERTFHLVLHGRDLTVVQASAKAGDREMVAAVSPRVAHGGQTPEELVLTFPAALEAGRTIDLHLTYEAPFAEDLAGLYRIKEGDAWYAYTQFEPNDARRMFPCFDEPGYKVPFDVSVTTPKGMIAVANSPETSRKVDGSHTTFRFAVTKPLPSYLVAIGVGDFDVREGPKEPVPIRLIAPKGKAELGQTAILTASELTNHLKEYFGVPYPYAKLDLVAVPAFAAGAMENAGLLTFREELLLLDPRRASTRAKRSLAAVLAHELAHQWFGNLVTAEWWNDLWLNEAMATWMEARIVDTWQPQFGARLEAVSTAHHIMDLDALVTARAVRQPVTSTSEAMEAFDGITYEKGAALLAMIERWIGRDAFQAGVRDYLTSKAFQSAKAETLLSALDKASRKDVAAMAATYLDKPGVPLVTAHLSCEQGSRWNVELQQEPWRPIGSSAPDTQQSWTTPVCVRVEGRKEPYCALMAAGAPSLVAGTGKCPAWIYPNDDSIGYYRFATTAAEMTAAVRADGLDGTSRLGLLSNMWAMVRAGGLEPDQALKLLPLFDKDNHRLVVQEMVSILSQMSDALVEDETRAAFRGFVAERLGRHKKALGWTSAEPAAASASKGSAKEDSDDRALLRRTVLFAMADLAEDPATLKEAEPIAQSWLKDAASVDGDAATIAVEIASRRAGVERLDALRAAAKRASEPQDRITAIRGMFGFDDKAVLERALDLFLTDEIRVSEARYALGTAGGRRAGRRVLVPWIKAHWPELRNKLAGPLAGHLVFAAGLVCTRAEKDEMEAFFTPKVASIEGAARPLAESLETASLCAELRARGAHTVTRALRKK
jgi:aminopeptidase N